MPSFRLACPEKKGKLLNWIGQCSQPVVRISLGVHESSKFQLINTFVNYYQSKKGSEEVKTLNCSCRTTHAMYVKILCLKILHTLGTSKECF